MCTTPCGRTEDDPNRAPAQKMRLEKLGDDAIENLRPYRIHFERLPQRGAHFRILECRLKIPWAYSEFKFTAEVELNRHRKLRA
jgi:hypothetical protein